MSLSVSCRGLVHIYRLEGYDVVALAGVDLDIAAGESVALLGPSGSGKSTLLHIFAGLLTPSAGRLTVGGHDMVAASAVEVQAIRGRDIGVVLQGASRNLLPYLSVEQNVRFAQQALLDATARRGMPAPREVLDTVGLSVRTRYRLRPADLTPAERQRLALAVALANRPGLLLVDEPTAHLDSRARDEVAVALEAVARTGTTVVVVTHDPAVGARFGRSVTIRDGRVGAEGRLGEEFSVIGRDGTVQLPPDVARRVPPGTLFRVESRPDGSIVLVPARPGRPSTGAGEIRSLPAGPTRAIGVARPALPFRPINVPPEPAWAELDRLARVTDAPDDPEAPDATEVADVAETAAMSDSAAAGLAGAAALADDIANAGDIADAGNIANAGDTNAGDIADAGDVAGDAGLAGVALADAPEGEEVAPPADAEMRTRPPIPTQPAPASWPMERPAYERFADLWREEPWDTAPDPDDPTPDDPTPSTAPSDDAALDDPPPGDPALEGPALDDPALDTRAPGDEPSPVATEPRSAVSDLATSEPWGSDPTAPTLAAPRPAAPSPAGPDLAAHDAPAAGPREPHTTDPSTLDRSDPTTSNLVEPTDAHEPEAAQ
ncbi:MAG TPA: ATP-binding cassette domain-containing protein [Micromonosporaceae bacterium]|nr:ATP-binding cassette domain-containing protein [Micromonosporaceae bacterium]